MTETENRTDLAGIVGRGVQLIADRGLDGTLALGGALAALLARQNDQGARAWTLEQASRHLGMEPLDGLAAYALHAGALQAWSTHAADVRQAELTAAQPALFVDEVTELRAFAEDGDVDAAYRLAALGYDVEHPYNGGLI
jgi:hypothetical protein